MFESFRGPLSISATAQVPGTDPPGGMQEPHRALLARGAAAPLITGSASCPCRTFWRAEFERPQDPLEPPRGREAPSRGSRRPWGVEWPPLSCHSNPRSALCLEDDAIKGVLRQKEGEIMNDITCVLPGGQGVVRPGKSVSNGRYSTSNLGRLPSSLFTVR